MYINASVFPLSSIPYASYYPSICTYLPLPTLHFDRPNLPSHALTYLYLPRLPLPAFAWPSSTFSVLPGLAYPHLRLSCILWSYSTLLVFIRSCFASSGLAYLCLPCLLCCSFFLCFLCLPLVPCIPIFFSFVSKTWFLLYLYLVPTMCS